MPYHLGRSYPDPSNLILLRSPNYFNLYQLFILKFSPNPFFIKKPHYCNLYPTDKNTFVMPNKTCLYNFKIQLNQIRFS